MDHETLKMIPKLAQRQDSTTDQLQDLIVVANRLGMYDAADFIRLSLSNNSKNPASSLYPGVEHRITENLATVQKRTEAAMPFVKRGEKVEAVRAYRNAVSPMCSIIEAVGQVERMLASHGPNSETEFGRLCFD